MVKALDLYCGGGGSSVGYARLGWDVTGVDLYPQPEYPYTFVQSDWKAYVREHGHEYDFIHAGPVCKGYAGVSTQAPSKHIREIPDVRQELEAIGVPYVIENVASAVWDMKTPVKVCGSAFKLRVRRHRFFESNLKLIGTECDHKWQNDDPIYLRRGRYSRPTMTGVMPVNGDSLQLLSWNDHHRGIGREAELKLRQEAMGIDWMGWDTVGQAIPPHYSEFIGAQIATQMSWARLH